MCAPENIFNLTLDKGQNQMSNIQRAIIIHLLLVVASVVDILLADCFAVAVACLDAVEPLTSAESLVLR